MVDTIIHENYPVAVNELDDIETIDSQSLTKLILGKFDWGIERKELYTIIDSINTPQTSQSNSHND